MNNDGISKKDQILNLLSAVEKEEEVFIFYACESGSRAWGFPSSDSDFDVRFLYIHPTEWYLSIEEKRDVIEREISDHIDLCGWDMKKALKLLRKSNPPLLEWLKSPIIYQDKSNITQRIRALIPEYYSSTSCLYHYLHMAEGNVREYIKGDIVWLKKYFYIMRPILACQWIEADLGPVPIEFEVLVDQLIKSEELRLAIYDLLKRKREGEELSRGAKVPVISEFCESEIKRLKDKQFDGKKRTPGAEKLNELFRFALAEVWGENRL